ncbi:MAG TPA: hypothetical protein VF081_00800 [Solirubrobacterales bacterium]
MKRIAIAFGALSLVGALAVSGIALARSGASSGLDRAYGAHGIATITQPPGDHFKPWSVDEYASARDGSVYVLGRGWTGNCYSCGPTYFVFRVGPSGAFDPGFGGETGVVLPSVPFGYGLSVDTRGRPLVFSQDAGAVTVRRYEKNGQADASFGTGGTVAVVCGCQGAVSRVVPAQKGTTLVEVDRGSSDVEYSAGPGARVSLTRLLANGALDPGFGVGGSNVFSLPGLSRPALLAVAKKGAVLLGGSSPRIRTLVYVIRVSAKGRLDTKFNRAASGAMRRLRRLGEFAELNSLLARGDGTVELLGPSRFTKSFDLRLRANGKLARGFGKRGLSVLPLPLKSATLGSGGAIFAITEVPEIIAFRVLKNGRLDDRFSGPGGVGVPVSGEGILVGTQQRRRAVVMDRGNVFCRNGGCEPTPGIARYIEPPPIRRHQK